MPSLKGGEGLFQVFYVYQYFSFNLERDLDYLPSYGGLVDSPQQLAGMSSVELRLKYSTRSLLTSMTLIGSDKMD